MKKRNLPLLLALASSGAFGADWDVSDGAFTSGIVVNATVVNSNNKELVGKVLTGGTIEKGKITSGTLKDGSATSQGALASAKMNNVSIDGAEITDVVVANPTWDTGSLNGVATVTLGHANIQSANVTGVTASVSGAAPTPASPAKEVKNQLSTEAANISYVGDYFHFLVEAPGFTPMTGGDATTVPANSCFRVDVDSPGSTKVNGKFVSLNSEAPSANLLKHAILNKCAGLEKVDPSQPQSNKYPPTDKEYTVDKAVFDNYSRERYGWTYGVLAAPFKYYPGQSQFSSSISIDAYLGYRIHDRQGSSTVLAFAAGPAFATVKTANGNSNINGASIAVALLSEIKRSFNVGVILGCDFFSKADGYALSGRPYLGINFGIKAD